MFSHCELPFATDPAPGDPLALESEGALLSADAWADERGVFIILAAERSSHLVHFEGARWLLWAEARGEGPSFNRLAGIAGSAVLTWPWSGDCDLRRSLRVGETDCVATDALDPVKLQAAFYDELDHGWMAGGESTSDGFAYLNAVRIDGERYAGSFNCYDSGDTVVALWGDHVGDFLLTPSALCAGGRTYSGARSDIPRGPYAAMWVESRDRMLVAASDGRILEYARHRWDTRSTGLAALTHMAGTPEHIVFAGPHAIGTMPREGEPPPLVEWSDPAWNVAALAAHGEDIYAVLFGQGCQPAVVRFTGGRATRL